LDLDAGKYRYSVKADLYWDGRQMPLEDNSVDGAILFEVVAHCPDPSIVIGEAFRVIKPGGMLLFSTPFLYQLCEQPFDYRRLTPYGAELLLSQAGFVSIEISPSGLWDASLAQMIGIWVAHRPMPYRVKQILRFLYVPVFKLLLAMDKRIPRNGVQENAMMPGLLGCAVKPRV
jgi:ubiquinone/menaquinone biosynthesis C-methylase UbiE